jgi:peroxiredoxin
LPELTARPVWGKRRPELDMKKALVGLVLIALLLGPAAACKKGLTTPSSVPVFGSKVGDKMADFTLVNQGGEPVSLSQFRGSVILLDFSADWCGPCRAEAARLEALFNEYRDRGLVILTLMIDGSPSAWAAQYGLTFPVLNDNAQAQWRIYGEGAVPLNMVLDRNLIIRYKESGFNESAIISMIKKYL